MARAQALTEVRGSDDMVAVSSAFKRIKNILRQAGEFEGTVATQALTEEAEKHLHSETVLVAPQVAALREQQQYQQARAHAGAFLMLSPV